MFDRVRIGMITPSSNTVVEPITSAITADLIDELSVHYARIRVTTISLERDSVDQFELGEMLGAARLLADAKPDVICWNGTSAAWKGLRADELICEAIRRETGVPATTASMAQVEAFKVYGVSRYALAVPYLPDVRDAIVRTYGEAGAACVSSRALGISTNYDFAEVGLDRLRALIRESDAAEAQAIVVVCTNLAAARVVKEMEQELAKPIFDSLILALWHPLRMLGWREPIRGWGRLLEDAARG